MSWKLDKTRPICPQICEQICVKIAAGEFKPNERLMSVREVAVTAGVNPNTVQKSFEQLDQKGIIYSVRGSGWYVSAQTETAENEVDELIRSKTSDYFGQMNALGMDNSEIKRYVKEWNCNE
ncbi:MAG: GntR family transcriptional regulator [Clostridia bacterium]|nr:GntR family transcriptional regulator [Clostridia bacterium]